MPPEHNRGGETVIKWIFDWERNPLRTILESQKAVRSSPERRDRDRAGAPLPRATFHVFQSGQDGLANQRRCSIFSNSAALRYVNEAFNSECPKV